MESAASHDFENGVLLKGEKYILKQLREGDVSEEYVRWLNDPEINRFLEVRFTAQNFLSVQQYVRSFYGAEKKFIWGIFPKTQDTYIGTTTLSQFNVHGSAELGLMIGKKEYWGQEASAEAMSLVLEFGFSRLGLRRITGGSYAPNYGMNFTFKRLGFRCEGKLVKAWMLSSGTYVDGYRWGILKEEWDKKHGD